MDQGHQALRNLLYNLVRRDLTVRYKSTVLGFLWSFLKPLALTGIFYVVFDKVLEMPLAESRVPFHLHLLTGILAWSFFAGATSDAMNVILSNGNLIKKVRLPLVVFPVSVVCSHLVHFVLALLVLVSLLILGGIPPGPAFLLMVPILALQFLLTIAVSLLLSALNVFYRDVSSIWEVLTTAWFYATPIIYPVYYATDKLEQVGMAWLQWLYLANPMAPIVLAYRRVMIYASIENPTLEMSDGHLLASLALCVVVVGLLLWLSHRVFGYFSKFFADEL